jgi:beta-phosphoglucomutase
MLQAVVFDFDGVLANSEPLHLRAFQSVLSKRGVALSAQEYYETYVGYDDETVFRELARERQLKIGPEGVAQLTAAKSTVMQDLLARGSPLFPGAAHVVRQLAARVPVAVASGAQRREILQVLEIEHLCALFTAIVAAGETPNGKPAPDPYQRAVELMSMETGTPIEPARVVAVEDSIQGLESARAAGLQAVAVSTTYRPELLVEAAAVLVLPDISALTYDRLEALWAAGH